MLKIQKQKLLLWLLSMSIFKGCLKLVDCQYAPPPQQVFISDELDGYVLKLNQPSIIITDNPYQPSEANCMILDTFFHYTDCYLDYDTNTLLHFKLSSNQTQIMVGNSFSSIQFPNIFQLGAAIFYIQFPFLEINPPQNTLLPQVTLLYPFPFADICSQISVTIIDQKITGNLPLKVYGWKIINLVHHDEDHMEEVQSILDSFSNSESIYFLPSQLREDYLYYFSVGFENFMGTKNTQDFQFATSSKSSPSIKIISPKSFDNIDFRLDFVLQVQYSGLICDGSGKTIQQSQIIFSLNNNQYYPSSSFYTNSNLQILSYTIPSQYLNSSTKYYIRVTLISSSYEFSQIVYLTTMNPILTSSLNVPSNLIIDNTDNSTVLEARYTYINEVEVDPSQFSYHWSCIDMSLILNDCSSMFNLTRTNNLNSLLNDSMYIITVRIQRQRGTIFDTSYSTVTVVKAGIKSDQNTKKPLTFDKLFSRDGITSNSRINTINFNCNTLVDVTETYYNPDIFVIYMADLKVMRVDFPQSSEFSVNLPDIYWYRPTIYSFIIKNRQMNSFYLNPITQPSYPNQYSLGQSPGFDVNPIKDLIEFTIISLFTCNIQPQIDVYIYQDSSQFNEDMAKKKFTYGFYTTMNLAIENSPSCKCKFNLRFPNNSKNSNQFLIVVVAVVNNELIQLTTTVTLVDYQQQSQISLLTYAETLYSNDPLTQGFQSNNDYFSYLNFLILQQLNYFEQIECSNKCTKNGSCQEVDELPFKQNKISSCICSPNFYFYDCSASLLDMSSIYNIISKQRIILYPQSIEVSLQLIKLFAQNQELQSNNNKNILHNIIPQIPNYKSNNPIFKNDYISFYQQQLDLPTVQQQAAKYFDYLIAYSNLYPKVIELSEIIYQSDIFNTNLMQMGMPSSYLKQSNYCGIVRNVPQQLGYLSNIFSNNLVIVNSVCTNDMLQNTYAKDVVVPFDETENLSLTLIYDLYVLFIDKVSIQKYPNQSNPGFYSSILFKQSQSLNVTLYFDIHLFYSKNGMLSKNTDNRKLVCLYLYTDSICQSSLQVLNGTQLIKCICTINSNTPLIVLVYDDNLNNDKDSSNDNNVQVSSTKNEQFSYYEIIIILYIGIFSLALLFFTFQGYQKDRKEKSCNNQNIRRHSQDQLSVDLSGQMLNQQKIQSFGENSSQNKSAYRHHSILNIYLLYSTTNSRLSRNLNAFYIYLSLPAFSGLIAKNNVEESSGVGTLVICFFLIPLALRIGVTILNRVIYIINTQLKHKRIKNILEYIIIIIYVIGLYGSLIYIYIDLWTDSDVSYHRDWLVYLAIMFSIHSILFEVFQFILSLIQYKKQQQKISNFNSFNSQKELEKSPSQEIILENNQMEQNVNQQVLEQSIVYPQIGQEQMQDDSIQKDQQQQNQQQKQQAKEQTIEFQLNVQQQLLTLKKRIHIDPVIIDGFDEDGNVNVPSECNIFRHIPPNQFQQNKQRL